MLTRGSPISPNERLLDRRLDQFPHLAFGQPARLGDRGDLRQGGLGRDVGIETGGRRRHRVGWNWTRAGYRPPSRHARLHPVDELLRRRAEIGARRIGGVVGRIDRLRGVVGVRVGRRRRPWMKVFVALEVLTDQRRADDGAALLDQAAVGLSRGGRPARSRSQPADRAIRSAPKTATGARKRDAEAGAWNWSPDFRRDAARRRRRRSP